MGRHLPGSHALSRRSPFLVPVAAAVAVVLVATGLVWWLASSGAEGEARSCGTTRTVALSVAPEIGPLVQDLLREPVELTGGACAVAEVRTQQPLQTVGDLGALEAGALPDVWVPDSSLWMARVGDVPLESSGSLATSPVVLATSRAAADRLGWTDTAPEWGAALATGLPLVIADVASSARTLSALAAVRSSLGGDDAADTTVVEAVLAAARGPALTPEEALAAAGSGDGEAPLVAVSEREVVTANDGAPERPLVAVYPAEGSPVLDYPVVRVGRPSEQDRPAVDAVVGALTSAAASEAARREGFRGADAAPFDGAGPATGTQEDAPEVLPVEPATSRELLGRLESLATPSRLLAVVDASTSMDAAVGRGTRATLARDSAKSALVLLPPDSAVGLWFFAAELDGAEDWESVVPTRRLDAFADGRSQTELLTEHLDRLPDRLGSSGTGLHDTALAAVRAAREDFDAEAVNSVVLLTDGRNQDRTGIGLEELVRTLEEEADPERPVAVIGIALGPDADLATLERIAGATGGAAYPAVEESDLQEVLFEALGRRS